VQSVLCYPRYVNISVRECVLPPTHLGNILHSKQVITLMFPMDTWSAYRSFLIAYRASEFTTFALATTHAPRFYTFKGTVLSRAKRIRLLPVRLLLTSTDFYRCDTSTQSLAIFWYRSIYTWCPLFPTIHYAPSFVTFNTLRVLLPMNVYLPSIIFRV
jgi:hypothetical protein